MPKKKSPNQEVLDQLNLSRFVEVSEAKMIGGVITITGSSESGPLVATAHISANLGATFGVELDAKIQPLLTQQEAA